MKRNVLVAILTALITTSLFAINPSARYETRMAYDAQLGQSILFGGLTAVDSGTKKAYRLDDTWSWTGSRWIQRFPAHVPAARAGHAMVYDSTRGHIVMFGGRSNTTDLNDTWIFQNNDWVQINTPSSPSARILPGAAYDPIRDRVVLYGGTQTSADNKTLTPVYDTWEFDGTTWTKIGGNGPSVTKPLLAYDAPRKQIIMLALDPSAATLMYAYDAASGNWNQVKPATLPACVNEGQLTYQPSNQTVVYTGGVCGTAEGEGADTTYEWDGTTWNKITATANDTRVFGAAMAFDEGRNRVTLFGGSPIVGSPLNDTWVYTQSNWFSLSDGSRPAARSLYAMVTDPNNGTVWLYGGSDNFVTYSDLWQYSNGQWTQMFLDSTPALCATPQGVYDTDRKLMVMVCANSDLYEFDGTKWTAHTATKNSPPSHTWGNVVYDPTLKKTVLFGGYDGANYLNETWTWDGTNWSRQKNHPPTARALTAMWYDPNLKKDVIYGGVGRVTSGDRISRYSDMWTFDGSGWTQLTPNGPTPGPRYAAQVFVDPRTNKVLLFGGMFDTVSPPVPPATQNTEVQSYVNDMWQWDGATSSWTQLHPATLPSPRENARMAFDPTRDDVVLFGGYGGTFLSDTWTFDGTNWHVMVFDPLGNRRRVTGR